MRKVGEESTEEWFGGQKTLSTVQYFPTVFNGLKGGLRMSIVLLPFSKSGLIFHNSMNTLYMRSKATASLCSTLYFGSIIIMVQEGDCSPLKVVPIFIVCQNVTVIRK